MKKQGVVILATAVSAVMLPKAFGQTAISYTGGTYTQNFDSLRSSGATAQIFTGGTNPRGPIDFTTSVASGTTAVGNTSLQGWQGYRTGGTGTAVNFIIDAGGDSAGGFHSYGPATGGSTGDRALGLLASNAFIGRIGAVFANSTPSTTFTSFSLSYFAEQWRRADTVAKTIAFSYAILPSTTDILPSSGGTGVAGLNATGRTTGTNAATDGNNASFRTAVSGTVSNISWAPGDRLAIIWQDVNDSGSDAGIGIDDLTFSAAAPVVRNLVWSGSTNGNWNTTTSNFIDGSTPTAFATNDNAAFDDTATTGAVTVAASGVTPAAVTFNNSNLNYVVTGGPILGTTGITKTGTGTLTLSNAGGAGQFSGGLTVVGGTAVVTTGAALGTNPVTVSQGGTFSYSPTTPADLTLASLTAGTNGGTFDVGGAGVSTVTVSGTITAGGGTSPNKLVKSGAGTLVLPTVPSSGLQLGVTGGNLTFGGGTTRDIWLAPEWATATAGNLTVVGAIRTNLISDNSLVSLGLATTTIGAPGSTGTISFTGSGSSGANVAALVADRLSTNVGNLATFNVNLAIRLDVGSSGIVVLGAQGAAPSAQGGSLVNGTTLALNAPIIGTGNVYFATQSQNNGAYIGGAVGGGGAQGVVQLNAASTYDGLTVVALNQHGVVQIGTNNALPTGTTLQFGDSRAPIEVGTTVTNTPVGSLDLNGRTLTVGAVTGGVANDGTAFRVIGGIVNNTGAGPATLVISGTTPNATYAGPIGVAGYDIANIGGRGNGNINITKSGTGTQSFTGNVSTVSGNLTVAGGRLVIAGTSSNTYTTLIQPNAIAVSGGALQFGRSTGTSASGAVPGVIVTSALSVASGADLDLTTNDLIIRNAASISSLVSFALAGRSGAGLRTSEAGRALVVFSNDDQGSGNPFFSSYDGVTNLAAGDVIIKSTYAGDTDLNGLVDGTDLGNIIEAISTPSRYAPQFDLNYDGQITLADLAVVQANFNPSAPRLGNGAEIIGSVVSGAVPEPTALGLLAAALPLAGPRRRRA